MNACGFCDNGTLTVVYHSMIGNPPERTVERCPYCDGTGKAAGASTPARIVEAEST